MMTEQNDFYKRSKAYERQITPLLASKYRLLITQLRNGEMDKQFRQYVKAETEFNYDVAKYQNLLIQGAFIYREKYAAQQPIDSIDYDENFGVFQKLYHSLDGRYKAFRWHSSPKPYPTFDEAESRDVIFLNIADQDLYQVISILLEKALTGNRVSDLEFYALTPQAAQKGNVEYVKDSYNLIININEQNIAEIIKILEEIRRENHQFYFKSNTIPGIEYNDYITLGQINMTRGKGAFFSCPAYFAHEAYAESVANRSGVNELDKLANDAVRGILSRYSSLTEKYINILSHDSHQKDIEQGAGLQQRKDYLCQSGMNILDDEDKRQLWIALVERDITGQNYGNYFDEAITILLMLKAEIPIVSIKSLVQHSSNKELVTGILKQFMDPQILKQLTSGSREKA